MNVQEQPLAALVMQHHQAAAILEKYGLDYCCRGKQTLQEACNDKGIAPELVTAELDQLDFTDQTGGEQPFNNMTATQLADYIEQKHHGYVRQSIPVISAHVERVVTKHGERFPWMLQVLQLFKMVEAEMLSHMEKEERVLFPAIRQIEAAKNNAAPAVPFAGFISQPIQVMEAEHEQVGNWMADIRRLTQNYIPPENACTTFRLSLAELKAFEEDLHQHVHLENYVLFPKAQAMC